SQLINNRKAHFNGMWDAVGVLNQALTKSEIKQLVNSPRLTGNESGLIAGWTFDRPATGQTLPPTLSRPVRLNPPAAAVAISADRNNASDAQTLPLPFQQTTMQLPLADEQAWVVIQGIDNDAPNASHAGYAAFCWDFMLAGRPQSETNGLPFYAAGPGTVVAVKQNDVNPIDTMGNCTKAAVSNFITLRQADNEFADYLHLLKDSAKVTESQLVISGRELAKASDVGAPCGNYHLHFAVTSRGENKPGETKPIVTFPVAFS